jgi:putative acetyltransferase
LGPWTVGGCEMPGAESDPEVAGLSADETAPFRLRTAEPGDRAPVVGLVRTAFATGGHDSQEEVDIVEATWASAARVADLELVALAGESVVGHVLAAFGDLDGSPIVGIAPLAVAPARQRSGVGTALMRELLERAERAGLPMVVLLGEPAYYSRFGFEPAWPLGITYRPAGTASPHFLLRRLAGFAGSPRGEYVYCWELPN